ncbi:centromere protein T [Sorex araneus]|uniref:centromere protein T n=1 Tax=Sorex araneus TaxID=42254 RepID=UPI0024339D99|nr:centromere protein T [Sorex araneus]
MADSRLSDSEPTVRTLLRHVLDTADPRTPRLRRSARTRAQKALLETAPSRDQPSQTKTTTRRSSQRIRSSGKVRHVQGSGYLDEQTPRTLLTNILLTAPESSAIKPPPVVKPGPALQAAQSSRWESSPGSPEPELPELGPSPTVAPGMLASSRRRQRLRLSEFEQGLNHGLLRPSQESHGNADASAVTSSLSLTFATPLQPQSVQRPGLARRPLTRRAVDVGAFLQDLRDATLASASPGDNVRTLGAPLPNDIVLEDTQPFSQPVVGSSPRHSALPCTSHAAAGDAERPDGPGLQNKSPENPAQHPAAEAEEAECSLASGLLNISSSISMNISSSVSRQGGAEPLQLGVLKEATERREERLTSSKEKETAMAQGSGRAGELEGDMEMTEKDGSCGALESMGPDESSADEDTSGRAARPESAAGAPALLHPRQPQLSLEPGLPSTTAVIPSEPASLPSTAQIRGPRPRTARPRTHQDPYKIGLSHYVKFFGFHAKMSMEKAALETVEKCLDKYFQHLCDDLEVYAAHAGRRTVRPEDLELLMRRQRLVTDQVSLHVFVERHLPLEYRQLLIPCAFSGNSVYPAQ